MILLTFDRTYIYVSTKFGNYFKDILDDLSLKAALCTTNIFNYVKSTFILDWDSAQMEHEKEKVYFLMLKNCSISFMLPDSDTQDALCGPGFCWCPTLCVSTL